MIKKHLVIIVLIIFTVLSLIVCKSTAKANDEINYYSLNFSDEHIPANDAKTKARIKKTLSNHHYQKLQTTKLHTKAKEWFPIIEPILKQYGIPKDFKYIPLAESGLHSGTSPKGASGHWQFMPQTARDFGLRVNMHVDDRQDIKKSTVAACKYLKYLYSEFKNWTLVAAAYNGGEGSVKRQIIKHNHKNYFSMSLNPETGTYVYKLIAIKEIIEKPHLHGYDCRKAFFKTSKVAKKFRTHICFDTSHLMQSQLALQCFSTKLKRPKV